ncbi:MAG: transglycosylase SLT domain-containing protein [Deltaproteobacteria bacterium]|nr:transglycosylase SLT domain-containing protein [Deltaproteobacteria bacterium]NIS77431.1 transglycosylase SLT domain-containing protein [Deltaproteobacteria bacterium]
MKEKLIVKLSRFGLLLFLLLSVMVNVGGYSHGGEEEGKFFSEEMFGALKKWVTMLRVGDYEGLLARPVSDKTTAGFKDFDLFLKGLAAYETGDFALGERVREQLAAEHPESFLTRYLDVDAAFSLLEKGDVDEAKGRMGGRQKGEPLFHREGSRFLYVMGRMRLAEGREVAGVDFLVECVKRFPGTEPALLSERVVVPLLLGKVNEQEAAGFAQAALKLGEALAGGGKFKEAASVLGPWRKRAGVGLGGKFDLALANALRRMNRYTDAISVLLEKRKGEPRESVAMKLFYAGIYNWYRGSMAEAENLLRRVLSDHGGTAAYGKAAYNLGRIKEEGGNFQEAYSYYQVVSDSDRNNLKAESSFRRGLVKFLAKDYDLAGKIFSENAKRFDGEEDSFRNLFFTAYSLEKKGELQSATSIYEQIVQERKGGLYYFLSLGKLGRFDGWEILGKVSFEDVTSAGLLESLARSRKDRPGNTLLLTRAIVFQRLGLSAFSIEELSKAGPKVTVPSGIPRKARVAVSAYASGNLRRGIELSLRADFPLHGFGGRYLDSGIYVKYPALSFIGRDGVGGNPDPFFLHAIIRQESLFDYSVISSAGAIGLGQIMPQTGKRIARELGVDDFTLETLFDPITNATFARFYLGSLIRRFGGNYVVAAAAYNGGEAAASRWRRKSGEDPYLFPEIIGYEETRKYVRRVFMHYLYYLKVYGKEWDALSNGAES